MIVNNRDIALDGLRYLWLRDKRKARAAYLRYMRDCTYSEIAQELHCSVERSRQLAISGIAQMGKYLNRTYGKSIALGA